MAFAFAFFIFVLYEIRRKFIDGIIRQMHKHVLRILRIGNFVGHSGKPCQSVFENVDFQRIYAV